MPQRLVASFLVRLVHEPGNEQIPWSITVQHIQTGRVFRLTDPEAVAALFQEVVRKEAFFSEGAGFLEERGSAGEGGLI
jgi:hypothetical protein